MGLSSNLIQLFEAVDVFLSISMRRTKAVLGHMSVILVIYESFNPLTMWGIPDHNHMFDREKDTGGCSKLFTRLIESPPLCAHPGSTTRPWSATSFSTSRLAWQGLCRPMGQENSNARKAIFPAYSPIYCAAMSRAGTSSFS